MVKKVLSMRLVDQVLVIASVLAIAGVSYLGYKEYRNQADISYWRSLSAEQVFHYRKINAQEEYVIGQDVTFKSEATFISGVRFEYNDVLRCKVPNSLDAYGFFSSYDSSLTTSKDKTEYESDSFWVFNGPTPSEERECILDSTIKATTPHGFQHIQSLRTGPFRFVEAE